MMIMWWLSANLFISTTICLLILKDIIDENKSMETEPVITADIRAPFKQNRPGDAGYDLSSAIDITLPPHSYGTMVDTQVKSMAIPPGHFGMVCSRSGLATKGITVTNQPGIVDSNYRGPVKAIMSNHTDEPYEIKTGDRIAQMIIVAHNSFDVVIGMPDDETVRGTAGFGSSGA